MASGCSFGQNALKLASTDLSSGDPAIRQCVTQSTSDLDRDTETVLVRVPVQSPMPCDADSANARDPGRFVREFRKVSVYSFYWTPYHQLDRWGPCLAIRTRPPIGS